MYLDKVGSTYYFRRIVPDELRPFFRTASGKPRTEFKISLGTKDRREAVTRCNVKAVEYDALFTAARVQLEASGPPRAPTAEERSAENTRWDAERAAEALASADNAQAHFEWEEREAQRKAIIKALADPTKLSPKQLALRDLIDDKEFASEAEKAFRQQQIEASWAEGEALVAAGFDLAGAKAPASPTGLRSLFQRYIAERQPAPATVKAWTPVIENLIAFLGHEDARRVTRANIVAWKNALLAEQNAKGEPARGARTVRETYLAAASVVLAWGAENEDGIVNVAKDVTVRVPKKEKLRDENGFTEDEAKTILTATFAPTPAKMSMEYALARRWVPWLCAYTGARVGEITQLRGQDVRKVGDIWTLRITPEAGRVKTSKARVVPLHEHLVAQGFPDVAKGDGPIFYNEERGRGGSDANPQHKKVGERLAKWVRSLGVDDPEVAPNHGWRHTFKTIGYRVGIAEGALDTIEGHAHKSEGRKYGTWTVDALARELQKFPRFDVGTSANEHASTP